MDMDVSEDESELIATGEIGNNILVCRFTTAGTPLWALSIGGSNTDAGANILYTKDGGIAVLAYTESYGTSDRDAMLIKMDLSGNILWTKVYPNTLLNEVNMNNPRSRKALIEDPVSGYNIIGYSKIKGGSDNDLFLIVTDSLGNTCCNDSSIIPSVFSVSLTASTAVNAKAGSLTSFSNQTSVTAFPFVGELVCGSMSNRCSSAGLNSIASETEAYLSWESIDNADYYKLTGNEGSSYGDNPLISVTVASHTLTAGPLENNTAYSWRIQPVCNGMGGLLSEVNTFTTGPLANCPAPKNLQTTNISASGATLSWDPAPFSDNYVLRGSEGPLDKLHLVFLTTSNNSISVGNLDGSTMYSWQVQNVCNSVNSPVSPFSSVNSFTTSASQFQKNESETRIIQEGHLLRIVSKIQIQHVEIYNTAGQLISQHFGEINEIEVTALKNGFYVLMILKENQETDQHLVRISH